MNTPNLDAFISIAMKLAAKGETHPEHNLTYCKALAALMPDDDMATWIADLEHQTEADLKPFQIDSMTASKELMEAGL